MKRFIEGADRGQSTLLPECLDDFIDESNPVRVIDAFVDALDLGKLGFDGVVPEATGRPSYHPSALLKLYIYGYLNRIQSSRRLEREAGRNLEVIWLLRRLTPDDKTIADFRKDNGPAIKKVCAQFVELCREMGLLTKASVAIDGSKFKAVNNRDKNFTRGKVERRRAQLEESVARYLSQLDTADRQEPSEALAVKTEQAEGEAWQARGGDGEAGGLREADACLTRSTDLADRSRQPLDGHERARLRRGRLQRAGGGRHRASSDRDARGDERRQRSRRNSPTLESRPRRFSKRTSSRSSPTAATSTARRSWPASKPTSR